MCHLEKFCHSSKLFTSAYELLSVDGQSGGEFTSGELHPILMKLLHDTNLCKGLCVGTY